MKDKIVFGYYDKHNRRVAWYGDTLGSLRSYPKVYSDTPSQKETVLKNLDSKVQKIRDQNYSINTKAHPSAITRINNSLAGDASKLIALREFQIKIFPFPPMEEGKFQPSKEELDKWLSVEHEAVFSKTYII
jgi:hypothetical protein